MLIEKVEKCCVFNERALETRESVENYRTGLKKLEKTCNFGCLEESFTKI